MRRNVLSLLVAALCACTSAGPIGRVELSLVPLADPDPFFDVVRVRMAVSGGGLARPPDAVFFARGQEAVLPPIPPGDGYVVRFDGQDAQGRILATGVTPPLSFQPGAPLVRKVLFGKVDRLSRLPGAPRPRALHTLTRLPDGRVLLLGGITGDALATPAVLADAIDVFDPASMSISSGSGTFRRFDHSSTLLRDGRVLLAGGRGADRTPLPNLDLLTSPARDGVAAGVVLPEARASHTATLLQDGRVLLVGGLGTSGAPLATSRIFDATSSSLAAEAPSLGLARHGHAATLLSDGTVLVTGGRGPAGVTDSAEIFTPGRGFSPTLTSMRRRRALHTVTALGEGRHLVAGGTDGSAPLRSLEVYDERTRGFLRVTDDSAVELELLVGRSGHVAAPVPGGILLAGGGDAEQTPPTATGGVVRLVLRDQSGTADAVEMLRIELEGATPRFSARAWVLDDGAVLVVGGGAPSGAALSPVGSVEVFVPKPD